MTDRVLDETARTLRAACFQFVEPVADVRPRLHAYCLRMIAGSGVPWAPPQLSATIQGGRHGGR